MRRGGPRAWRSVWRAAGVVALALLPFQAGGQAPGEAPPALCQACHGTAVEHWRQGPHAAAGSSLDASAQRDPRCQRCHVSDGARVDEGVGCEACHGDLAAHLAAPKKPRMPGLAPAERCIACHTAATPSVRPFDLEAGLVRVRHPREVK